LNDFMSPEKRRTAAEAGFNEDLAKITESATNLDRLVAQRELMLQRLRELDPAEAARIDQLYPGAPAAAPSRP
jgi:hypothetical protein